MEQKWMNEVEVHHEMACDHNTYERAVMFTCLYGSQNYGYRSGITPLYNADGTLQIYKGE